MKEIAISKFKATCLAVLEEVRRTREPVLVTRRGKPVAQVTPPAATKLPEWMGSWRGKGVILGDIVSPAGDPEDWEAIGDPYRVLDPERRGH